MEDSRFQKSKAWLTPAELARQMRVGRGKIMGWIHAGELKAVNVAASTSTKPIYRVLPDHVQEFQDLRTTSGVKVGRASPARRKWRAGPQYY
jgi:hypothetical protein